MDYIVLNKHYHIKSFKNVFILFYYTQFIIIFISVLFHLSLNFSSIHDHQNNDGHLSRIGCKRADPTATADNFLMVQEDRN